MDNLAPNAHPEIAIHIDNKEYQAPKSTMTGLELRQLAKPPISPDRNLFQEIPGQDDDRKIGDGDTVVIQRGLRFYSAPGRINPGDTGPRLPVDDERYLAEKGFTYRLERGGIGVYLIIKNVPVSSERYNRSSIDLMLQIPSAYPMAGLDMYWVSPELRMKNGSHPEAASHFEQHLGVSWQRFSRHLGVPWIPGQDSLASFLALALGELQGKR